MYKILIVEDDKLIHNSMKNFLLQEGYEVYSAMDGECAINLIETINPHLVLLDIMLPKLSGDIVLRFVRKDSNVPIIMISALSDEQTQIIAYENKADDYIIKPFSMPILLLKIAAILNRIYGSVESKTIIYQDIKLHLDSYQVFLNDKEIIVTATEFKILSLLLTNQGRVFNRDQMVEMVFGYEYDGFSRNIDTHIKNIRKKLGNDIIVTVSKIGYKVNA